MFCSKRCNSSFWATKRMKEKRDKIQGARKRDDGEILKLFGNPFWAVEERAEYAEALGLFAEFFGFSKIFDEK